MKYIVSKDDGFEEMFIFSLTRQHSDVARDLGLKKIMSAGQFVFYDGNFTFSGESLSLGIQSRPDDKKLFLKQFGD